MKHRKHFFFIFVSIFLLSSCIGPNFQSPKAPKTYTYTNQPLPNKTIASKSPGGESQAFLMGSDIPAQWWMLFQSPEINQLIEKGLNNNPTVHSAQAALAQSQQNYRATIGNVLIPAINLNSFVSRNQINIGNYGDPSIGDQLSIFNLYNAQVGVTYLVNFGMLRQVEASAAQVEYQVFNLEATYLMLMGNIVTSAITLASLERQIEATKKLVAYEKKQLDIIQAQFELGGASKIDVTNQKTEMEQTIATLPVLENQLAATRHSLAILIGELPSEAFIPNINLDAVYLPTELPVSLPSNLVKQRPDVRAAEAMLHQACAEIGIATANLLPQFNLTGNYGPYTTNLSNFFSSNSIVWNIEAQMTQPLFHGGALWADRQASIDYYNQAAAQYRETVLTAFKNVADALKAIEYDALALQANYEAEAAAKETLDLTEIQFKYGAVNYPALLISQYQYHQAMISRIQAQAMRYSDTAALFQALGGGWWNRCEEQSES